MEQEIIEEALKAVQSYVLMGFDNKEEIFENIINMFYAEEDFDEDWLKSIIDNLYNKHQAETSNWKKPTDFDKLVATFDFLIKKKVVCLQWAGSTKQDGENDCKVLIKELKGKGVDVLGYCYYHMQDLERAIDPDEKKLYLGFDSATGNDNEALFLGNMICKALVENGLEYVWEGDIEERIRIENINWQKIPSNEDYSKKRVLRMLLGA